MKLEKGKTFVWRVKGRKNNSTYTVTSAGSATAPFVLERKPSLWRRLRAAFGFG